MSLEQMEKEVPEELKLYERHWSANYGKDVTEGYEEVKKLAEQLASHDEVFKGKLEAALSSITMGNKTSEAWAYINAMSERGKDFNLHVD